MSSQVILNGLVVMIMMVIVEYTHYQSTVAQSKQSYGDMKSIDQDIKIFLESEKWNA
jgi:hypothetical protein